MVFESCLEQLFSVCKTCYSPCDVSMKGVGTLLVVRTSCPAGHTNRWDSQPYINGRGAGNLLLTSLVLFTGASPTRTLRLFQLMNIQVFSKKTYFNYQRAILVPAVEEVNMMPLLSLSHMFFSPDAVFHCTFYVIIAHFSINFHRCGETSKRS